jgi:drug/metabolite transporter (DMT)-like permease
MNGVRVSKKAWLGMAISFIGVLVITGVDLNISTKSFFGDLAALIGGALAALYVMAGAKAQREVESTTYMAICYFVCAISALPIALLISPNIFQFEARQWLILLGLILGAQLLGHSMFNSVLKRVSPAVVSLIVFFEVPVAALLATWWLDQKPAGGIWLGIILILIGCALVILRNDEN